MTSTRKVVSLVPAAAAAAPPARCAHAAAGPGRTKTLGSVSDRGNRRGCAAPVVIPTILTLCLSETQLGSRKA